MGEKIYRNHRMNSRKELIEEIQRAPVNKERSFMIKMLKNCVDYLDQYGIYEYQNLIIPLKNFGFKTNDIRDYIIGFQTYINSQNQFDDPRSLNWINKRCIHKSNLLEKNLIINRLAYQYPNEILYYTNQCVRVKFPIMINIEIIFQEFQKLVDQLHSSAINI